MVKKLLPICVLSSVFLTLAIVNGCFAEGWQGSGNYNTATSSGIGGGGGDGKIKSTAWVHFNYIGNKNGQEIWMAPQYLAGQDAGKYGKTPMVSGMCAHTDVGFWTFAAIVKEDGNSFPSINSPAGNYSEIGIDEDKDHNPINTYYYTGVDAGYLRRYAAHNKKDTYINSNNEYMLYRLVNTNGWATYDTLSFDQKKNGAYIQAHNPGGDTASQILYYGKVGDGVGEFDDNSENTYKMYQLDMVADKMQTVYDSYKLYLVNSGEMTQDEVSKLEDAMYDENGEIVYNSVEAIMRGWKKDEKTGKYVDTKEGVYAFCSYENASKTANLDTKSTIKLGNKTSQTSDWDKTSTNSEPFVFRNKNDFSIEILFDYKRSEKDFAINKISNGSAVTLYYEESNGSNMQKLYESQSVDIPAFANGVAEIKGQHKYKYPDEHAKTLLDNLKPNTVYKFCASIKHVETVTVAGSTQTTNGEKNSESVACVTAKYEPITAEVDSHTEGKVEGKYLASGSTGFNSYKSDVDGDKTFSINVRPQPMKITWNNYLGYKNLSKTTTTVKSKYGINSEVLDINEAISAYPNDEPVATGTIDTGVFPGETREEKRSIYHPSKVEASSGNAAAGAVKEHSSVTLKLYADDLRCGLDNDHMYNIGVDHPDDYFWLSMQRGDSNKVTVGSGMASLANLWFNPSDQMRVTQVACFGRQILVDSMDRPNKWTTNPWGINGATLDNHAANTMFRLGGDGHDAIRSTGVFTIASAANYVGSHGGSSLWASEIGGTSSTPTARISKGYKLEATSDAKQISHLGEDLQLTFYNSNEDQSASINAKIPYNYSLKLSFDNSSSATILDDVTSFKPEVANEGRMNAQLCAGRNSTCDEKSIGTATRKTSAATLIFTIDDSFTYEALKNNYDFAAMGNNTTETGIINAVRSRLGNAVSVIDNSYFSYKDSGKKAINANGTWKLNNPATVDSRNYPVGTKICGVVAAYPSDSHNTGDNRDINDENQAEAFNSYGGEFQTKFNISCRTVAKRQTMSVEGNGIATLGPVKSSRVYYGEQKRIFGSWSEYQIIASGSDGPSASSGAVTAYGLDGTGGTTEPFATKAADTASISGNSTYSLLFPQSLGNTKGDPYAPYEAKINWQYSENLISLIKNKYVSSNGSCADITENKNRRALRCFTGDQSLENSQVSIADMDTIVIYSSGKLTITANLSIPDTSRQLIIIAKSIEIASNVNEVNAWLIVDGGEFNTCAEHIIDHPKNPNSYGNMELLQECYNNLQINGPVILKTGKGKPSGPNMIQLPRTFGGGSKPDGDSFVRAPETYVQRAEVFNYDPEIVEWAYNESRKEPQIVTTYTESLTPRL